MFLSKLNRLPILLLNPEGSESGKTEESVESNIETNPLADEERELEASRKAALEEAPEAEDFEEPIQQEQNTNEPDNTGENTTVAPKPGKVTLITDDFISKAPKEERKFLEGVKGETFSDKALKNYIHAQKFISEQKKPESNVSDEQVNVDDKPFEQDIKEATLKQNQPTFKPPTNDELTKITNNRVYAELKVKYPDIPEDVLTNTESRKDFLRDLNYDDPENTFREDFMKVSNQVQGEVKEYAYLTTNWESFVTKQVQDEVKAFNEYLTAKNIKPDDIGIQYTDKFLIGLLVDENGQYNPNTTTQKYNMPVVKKGALTRALKDIAADKLIEAARLKGKEEGFNNRINHVVGDEPGLGNVGRGSGNIDKPATVISDDMSLEQMDKVLEYNRKLVEQEDSTIE